MKYLRLVLMIVFLVLLTTSAIANDQKSSKPMNPEEMMEVYTKLATPGEPHKLLASIAGSWTTKTKEWIDPQIPPVESTGTVSSRMMLDGRFLQQEITGSMHGRPHTGIWTVGYDNLLKRYISTWIDTMSTQIFIMDGTASADGKAITLTGQHAEVGGGHMTHRAIWKILDSNTQEFIMYGTYHGGQEMKMMEVLYTRKQ